MMRPGLSIDLELQKRSNRDLKEMTRHVSLDPVGKTLSKPFLSQAASFITLQDEVALCHPSGTAASSANQVSRETYLKLLWQSQAWLTSFRLILLFSESMSCACDLRRSHRWFIVSFPNFPYLKPQTKNTIVSPLMRKSLRS